MEVLLALAVLVAIGAVVWPALQGPLAQARLKASAQELQAVFGQGRLLAMSTGETCVVEYSAGGNEYRLEPLNAGEAALTDEDSIIDEQQALLNTQQRKLKDGVVFANQELIADDRGESSAMLFEQRQNKNPLGEMGAAQMRIFFYADGTSSTARIILSDQENRQIAVELRGITGMARVYPVEVLQ
jgi:Tfp pilus assembly protein FimT